MAQFNQSLMLQGLNSVSVTVPVANDYIVEGKITIPTLSGGGGTSSLVAVVNKNGSPVYTGSAGQQGFHARFACAALDVIQVVFSSGNANDAALNAVKSSIYISSGE